MARPSKLSPAQWVDVERRVLAGESVRSLAKEFGLSEGAIRQRVSTQTAHVRNVAQKLAEVQSEIEVMPVRQQYAVITLADKLRNISASLASAAELGAATAHRLHALANSEVAKVDDAEPMASIDSLKNVGILTKLANESSVIARDLMAANRDQVRALNDAPPQRRVIDPRKMSDAALQELLSARAADA